MLIHSRGCFSSYPSHLSPWKQEGKKKDWNYFLWESKQDFLLLTQRGISAVRKNSARDVCVQAARLFFYISSWWHVYAYRGVREFVLFNSSRRRIWKPSEIDLLININIWIDGFFFVFKQSTQSCLISPMELDKKTKKQRASVHFISIREEKKLRIFGGCCMKIVKDGKRVKRKKERNMREIHGTAS